MEILKATYQRQFLFSKCHLGHRYASFGSSIGVRARQLHCTAWGGMKFVVTVLTGPNPYYPGESAVYLTCTEHPWGAPSQSVMHLLTTCTLRFTVACLPHIAFGASPCQLPNNLISTPYNEHHNQAQRREHCLCSCHCRGPGGIRLCAS